MLDTLSSQVWSPCRQDRVHNGLESTVLFQASLQHAQGVREDDGNDDTALASPSLPCFPIFALLIRLFKISLTNEQGESWRVIFGKLLLLIPVNLAVKFSTCLVRDVALARQSSKMSLGGALHWRMRGTATKSASSARMLQGSTMLSRMLPASKAVLSSGRWLCSVLLWEQR